ncbi:MAG TPA: prolyl oligopeptidase family serine peptidase [archaeon]|nr:prolyl oligopeptidase family serine peptidase [archaeon]
MSKRRCFRYGNWIVVSLALLAFFALPLGAQFNVETVSVGPERMIGYLNSEGERVTREAWERIDSREKLEKEKSRLHEEYMFMIGLEPLPPRTPLEATVVRTVDCREYTIEVLHYQSLPGFYVTANLYKPKKGKGPFPGVIWGPGHSSDPYGAKALRQNYAIPWVRSGYICLVIDPIQVAEVFGVHRGTHSWELYDWYARGYTPIGIEVWNAMRGVDYLLTRGDVDGSKLTINGVSGGGHLSWMTGAADDRFAVVQPVAGTSNIETHIKLDLQRMHCDCAYFINTYRHDWPTLAALIAPRPLLMHNSSEDSYYPPLGYKAVLERAKEIYSWFGIADKTGMFEVPGPHGYTKEQCERAVEWSDWCLSGKKSKITEKPFAEVPGEQLAALGGVNGEHPPNINACIQELLIPTARLEDYDNLQEWERKRAEVMDRLCSVVFRNLPAEVSWVTKAEGEHGSYVLETEPGIQIGMVSYIPESAGPKQRAILYIASEGDTEDSGIWNFMKAYPFKGYAASRHMVYPRGIGTQVWNTTLKRRFQRSAMLLGRTVDDMRLYDVLCAVDHIARDHSFDSTELTVAGKGVSGLLGAYAALLDPRITRVILHSPPLTHKDGPVFLNVLRYTDIPQALAMLAPRELVFLTHQIDDFCYTRKIYRLYGAEDKFRRCYTVPQALNLKK